MKKEFEQQLRNKYPLLFSDKGVLMDYLDVGDGWYHILEELCAQLPQEEQFRFVQIKEKFGILRIYTYNCNELVLNLITEAEQKSGQICEQCAQPGSQDNYGGWFLTLCQQHQQERRKDKLNETL